MLCLQIHFTYVPLNAAQPSDGSICVRPLFWHRMPLPGLPREGIIQGPGVTTTLRDRNQGRAWHRIWVGETVSPNHPALDGETIREDTPSIRPLLMVPRWIKPPRRTLRH